jgi:FkbM family methyltransferase
MSTDRNGISIANSETSQTRDPTNHRVRQHIALSDWGDVEESTLVIESARPFAERLGRRRSFRRRLPERFGGETFRASTEGGLKYLRRAFWESEPTLLGFAADFVEQGSVVWDIGANVGLFSFASAGLSGPDGGVVALEPDTWLVELLRRSASRTSTRASPVEIVPSAVAGEVGIAKFHVAKRARATSHLASSPGTTQTGGTRSVESVIVVTLDFLLNHFPPPNVLKIDVEQSELDVLHGASEVLERCRPTVLIEVGDNQADAVSEVLRNAGYALFDASSREPTTRATADTLARPI